MIFKVLLISKICRFYGVWYETSPRAFGVGEGDKDKERLYRNTKPY